MSASTVTTSASSGASSGGGAEGRDDGLLLGMFTRTGAVWCAVLGVAFLAVFYRWVFKQGEISVTKLEDWGHALVIPIISGYLLWKQRDVVARTPTSVFWPASVVFALGIVSYVYCLINIQNHMLQGASLVLTLGGLVLWLTGPLMLRPVFLPIAYLVLSITIAESIMLGVTFKLQMVASQGAWLMLSLIGAPFGWFSVDATGNVLEIITSGGEVLPMNVAEACSGMRMVVAFYALAGAVALLGTTQWWQRIALMLLAGPVAVLMNMVRVTVLGLLMLIDPDLAAGDAHMVIGTILLFPSLLLFMGIVWALNKIIEPAGVAS